MEEAKSSALGSIGTGFTPGYEAGVSSLFAADKRTISIVRLLLAEDRGVDVYG